MVSYGAHCKKLLTAVATSWPPGLLRLGLSEAQLDYLGAVARQEGPSRALTWLVSQNQLVDDRAQAQAAKPLDSAWSAVRAHAEDLPIWRRERAAWQKETYRLRAELLEKLEKHRGKVSTSKSLDNSNSNASHVAAEPSSFASENDLVLPPPPSKPVLSSRGCYIWGDAGRGKTLLMDLFSVSCRADPSEVEQSLDRLVQRVHYHKLMYSLNQQMGDRLFRDRQCDASDRDEEDPVVIFCCDEFQITTIADASVVTPYLSDLFLNDAIVVMTSNKAPKQLYEGSVNRFSRTPAFLESVEANLVVHHLEGPLDYRTLALAGSTSKVPDTLVLGDFITFGHCSDSSKMAAMRLETLFNEAIGDAKVGLCDLPVAWGRKLKCKSTASGVARFTFSELCGAPLSAEDYATLVMEGNVHTIVLSDVPQFNLRLHNEARRFTNLVDALYEHQCRLVCTATSTMDDLLAGMDRLCSIASEEPIVAEIGYEPSIRKHGEVPFHVTSSSPCRPDTFATAEADAEAGTSVFSFNSVGADSSDAQDGIVGVMPAAVDSIRESGFAARRCTSRLREMNSSNYRQSHNSRWGQTTGATGS